MTSTSHYVLFTDGFQFKPIVNIDNALDLSSHISSNATDLGVSLKSYDVAREHLKIAKKHVGGDGDILGIYGAVRLESGLSYSPTSSSDTST